MLGFPAIFYIVKKQQNLLSLSVPSEYLSCNGQTNSRLNILTPEPSLLLHYHKNSFSHETGHKLKYNDEIKIIKSKNTTTGFLDTGQSNKPLKVKPSTLHKDYSPWADIEFALKIAAPVFILSLSSVTISSQLNSHKISKMLTKIVPQFRRLQLKPSSLVAMYSGGDAGAIREAGGAFANKEQAQEAQYFRKLQQEQLAKLKSSIENEIAHHEAEIKRHQEAIARHQKAHKDLGEK